MPTCVDFSRVDALYVTPSVGADGGWIVITDDLLTADGKRLRACDIGRGQVARFAVGGIRFQLLRKLPDGSYRIRVTRSR